MTDLRIPLHEQLTVTGQLPAVVRVPTFHVHDAVPVLLAVFGVSPAAVEGPDLYTTTMVQYAPGLVLAVAVAYVPGLTGELNEVNVSMMLGRGVGTGVGLGVGRGVATGRGVEMGVGRGVAVGDADGVGVGVGVSVGDAVGATGATVAACDGESVDVAVAFATKAGVVLGGLARAPSPSSATTAATPMVIF